jgi:hypothetical protein
MPTFFFSLVCQHRAESDITNTPYVLHGCVELIINDNTTLVVHLNTDRFEVKPFCIWATAHGNKDYIRFQLWERKSDQSFVNGPVERD